jgi:hypothetical protein
MVWAPASTPRSVSSLRNATIWSSTPGATRVGERRGRLERGLSPSSPSSRYRAISSYSQLRETSWDSQTSLTLRPSTSTALMT